MQRFSGLVQLASRVVFEQTQSRLALQATTTRYLQSSAAAASEAVKPSETQPDKAETEHATGMEHTGRVHNQRPFLACRQEIEGLAKGVDIFHESWIDAEFDGTPEDPVVVTSAYEERIVGVPDPEDDCLVVWGLIKANEPPRQLIDGGEYFVLKTVAPPMWSGIPEGFKGDPHH